MKRPVGIIGTGAIAAIAIAWACGTESGAVQPSAPRRVASQAMQRPDADRFSAASRRRAETERAWNEAMRERCAAPAPLAAPPGPPPAC